MPTTTPPLVEHHSFDYIPLNERRGSLSSQTRLWFMVNATLLTAFTGAIGPSLGMGLTATLVAIVTGSVFGTLFQAFHGAQGPHMGLPQMIQSRVQFGSRGVVVPMAVAAVIPIGFAVFYLQAGASAAVGLTGGGTVVTTAFIGVAAAVLCVIGYRLIMKAQGLLAYAMLANLVLLTVAAFVVLPIDDLLGDGVVTPLGFLAQFGAAAGYQIAIAPIVSDFTRYLPATTKSSHVSAAVFIGTITSAIWVESLGAVASLGYPQLDVVGGLGALGDDFVPGLGSATMIIAIAVFIATAAVGLYSGSIAFLSAAEAFKPLHPTARLRTVTVIVAAALVLAAALALPTDILASFSIFLTLLGYLLIPWTAVNLTDYYLVRRGVYSISDILRTDGGLYGRWGVRGLVSYGLGLAVMVPFASTAVFTGPAAQALGGVDISFAIGLPVAALTYWLLMRPVDLAHERAEISRADVTTTITTPLTADARATH